MSWRALALLSLAGCWGSNAYIIEGEVIEVTSETKLVIRHKEVPGLMPAMTMPFVVKDPNQLDGIEAGDQVYARLITEGEQWWLADIREHNKPGSATSTPSKTTPTGPRPLRPGATLPSVTMNTADGSTVVIGAEQGVPTLVTFLFTTCPRPDFCPAITMRLQQIQAALGDSPGRLVAVTIDPEHDTNEALTAYASEAGAQPDRWVFVRPTPEQLADLTARASLTVDTSNGTDILHALRTWVLQADGRLIERYDDARFPVDRVVAQLRTGRPDAPAGSDGTITEH